LGIEARRTEMPFTPKTYHPADFSEFAPKWLHPRWISRITDAMVHVCIGNRAYSHVRGVSVHRDFPAKGSAMFTRDVDGKRFKLKLKGDKWIAKEAAR
jgi:hypothetical protein